MEKPGFLEMAGLLFVLRLLKHVVPRNVAADGGGESAVGVAFPGRRAASVVAFEVLVFERRGSRQRDRYRPERVVFWREFNGGFRHPFAEQRVVAGEVDVLSKFGFGPYGEGDFCLRFVGAIAMCQRWPARRCGRRSWLRRG